MLPKEEYHSGGTPGTVWETSDNGMPNLGEANFDYLFKVMYTSFLHWKVPFFNS